MSQLSQTKWSKQKKNDEKRKQKLEQQKLTFNQMINH